MKNKKLAEIWNKYFLGSPYKLGGKSKSEGYDCVSAIIMFYRYLGIDIAGYKGITIDNYLNYWNDKLSDTELIRDWILSLGNKISFSYRQPGDILMCLFGGKQWFASIYLGNDICSIITPGKIEACPVNIIRNQIKYTVRLSCLQ